MKPNLIYIFPDEFRPYSMGFLGKERVKTPNLDQFAREGTTCTNVVSNFPICSPYRAILMSGKYPKDNGVLSNCHSASDSSLKEDLYCISDCLSDEGYNTAYIGKWHLDTPGPGDDKYGEGRREDGHVWDCFTPPGRKRHNFHYWYSYGCCDQHNNPHYWTNDTEHNACIHINEWSAKHETDVAIDYIKKHVSNGEKEKPFALFLAYNPPHMPFNEVPEKYKEIYEDYTPDDLLVWDNLNDIGREKAAPHIKDYYSMISGIDDQFGRILEVIKSEGIEEDTVVIFTSDHGEMMGSHGLMHKQVWYNESLLVPFLIKYPGKIREGIVDNMLISTIDHYKTIMGLLGIERAELKEIDGKDLSERLMTGYGDENESALYMYIDEKNPENGMRGIKTDRYTFVLEIIDHIINWYCFDNIEDPSQLDNIYGSDAYRDYILKKELIKKIIEANDTSFCPIH